MIDYIIVQAGGKGTRLEYLTRNKPKALVPVGNLPMIFHLFKKFPDKRFIIIGDYKIEVLKKYLYAFADVKYIVVDAGGNIGTCSGIRKAIDIIPQKCGFMLVWSDLVLHDDFELPGKAGNYIGLAKDFLCRWRYDNGIFEEQPSDKEGVAGLFVFSDKSFIEDVPESGEFVKWLKERNIFFDEIPLYKTKEYGTLEEYQKIETMRCRPFNRITVKGSRVIKEALDSQGKQLAVREKAWYMKAIEAGFRKIPEIYSYEPFEMEKIDGKNVFEYNLSIDEKKAVLAEIISCLKELHGTEQCGIDYFSVYEAYYKKTAERLNKVRDLIPFAKDKTIMVNGRRCRNIFYYMEQLEKKVCDYKPGPFKLIHGDCTFSNIILKGGKKPIFIDPRGYFGYTEIYGDPAYDWAKLYYSINNYDQFNLKKFRLIIEEDGVSLKIDSNGWESLEEDFFNLIGDSSNREDIKMIHAIIWLSLTTYAWEDYDSVCGAFYNGLYHMEEIL